MFEQSAPYPIILHIPTRVFFMHGCPVMVSFNPNSVPLIFFAQDNIRKIGLFMVGVNFPEVVTIDSF